MYDTDFIERIILFTRLIKRRIELVDCADFNYPKIDNADKLYIFFRSIKQLFFLFVKEFDVQLEAEYISILFSNGFSWMKRRRKKIIILFITELYCNSINSINSLPIEKH